MAEFTEWVVLELTSKAEGEDPDVVRASIRHHIRDAEVFVPASVVQRGDNRVVQYLVDGYAFILHKHAESIYSRLTDTKYVQGALYTPTGIKREKKLRTVSKDQIEKLRKQIKVEVDQGIEVGDTVVVVEGMYKNISAEVREEVPEQDSVVVHIRLRSTDRLVTFPRAFLRLEQKAPQIVYKDRLDQITRWSHAARNLLSWPPNKFSGILSGFKHFLQWDGWLNKSLSGAAALRAYFTQLDFAALSKKARDYRLLYDGAQLFQAFRAYGTPLPDLSRMAAKQMEWSFLNDAHSRVVAGYGDLKRMIPQSAPINLIVDGTQLFIRCAEVPGLSSLTDAQGRPTGAIVGFLRSLGSYKKRFPNSVIYVCWDGSSQRRKALYPDYKGQRASRSGALPFGWDWLREALPLLGVKQAYQQDEEADDVMASLVRGPLQGQPNVLITTDRDMLQLVSEFTHQLTPAMGSGKEKLYDPALVETEYGVPPNTLVHVRALSGDTSDNIPGAQNFGLKTAAKVVKLYGTVNRLLSSNLAGLSKTQIENLRLSEKQILLNLELLKLYDIAFQQIESNPNQIEVEARLKSLAIKADSILAAFFPV
jgi:5'-3' exonuclease/transcription antitermination factor NusG